VAALVFSKNNKTCYQPIFESTTLLQMRTNVTLTQAAEMTPLADNGCCTTTFR